MVGRKKEDSTNSKSVAGMRVLVASPSRLTGWRGHLVVVSSESSRVGEIPKEPPPANPPKNIGGRRGYQSIAFMNYSARSAPAGSMRMARRAGR